MVDNKYCYNCSMYKPYYTKGYHKFDICDIGFCCKKKETVEKHCNCSLFGYKHRFRIDRKQAALAALNEHVNILSEIKQILEENDEDLLEQFLYNLKEKKRRKKD